MKTVKTAAPRPVTLTVELSGQDILDLLRRSGHILMPDARIFFRVPRGGDYSGMAIDITENDPITVAGLTGDESGV